MEKLFNCLNHPHHVVVKAFNNKGTRVDFSEFYTTEGENLFTRLEEVLFIMGELEPMLRTWRHELYQVWHTTFGFHHTSFSEVYINGVREYDIEITVQEY